jgi:hypothetical protein
MARELYEDAISIIIWWFSALVMGSLNIVLPVSLSGWGCSVPRMTYPGMPGGQPLQEPQPLEQVQGLGAIGEFGICQRCGVSGSPGAARLQP